MKKAKKKVVKIYGYARVERIVEDYMKDVFKAIGSTGMLVSPVNKKVFKRAHDAFYKPIEIDDEANGIRVRALFESISYGRKTHDVVAKIIYTTLVHHDGERSTFLNRTAYLAPYCDGKKMSVANAVKTIVDDVNLHSLYREALRIKYSKDKYEFEAKDDEDSVY